MWSNEPLAPTEGVEFRDQLCECEPAKKLFIRVRLQVQLWFMTALRSVSFTIESESKVAIILLHFQDKFAIRYMRF